MLDNRVKYNYNRQYFKNIDTPQKAYWVGFILGDGWLGKYNIDIVINKKDIQLLYNFINEIGGGYGQIRERKELSAVRLPIYSKQMVQDLIKIGIPCKNKTFNAVVPDITEEFMSAFYLGLFDADGSVGIYYRDNACNWKRFHISLLGTKSTCKSFSDFLGYGGKYVYNRGNYWTFLRSNNSIAEIIYDKLYKFDIPCLDRKKNIFKRWMCDA